MIVMLATNGWTWMQGFVIKHSSMFLLEINTYLLCTIAYKALSHTINSDILTDTNPCINKAIHMLMHRFGTFILSFQAT